MTEFNPEPGDRLKIGGTIYAVMPHPAVPTFAFGQEGRKAFVYQISAPDGQTYALKKFKQAYRVAELVDVCKGLARFAQWPGLYVCDRVCLHPKAHKDALSVFPDLEYAVLMPWITGSTWYDMIIGSKPLTRRDALVVAASTARVLAALEEAGLAHCDIAAPNVIINPVTGVTQLIDVEDLYSPKFNSPGALPAGTEGYAHHTAQAGLWGPLADRFAGAVILAEMAAWHDPAIRKLADEEHYFGANEMQQDCPRYQALAAALGHLDGRLPLLFEQAWFSDTLQECPPMQGWSEVLREAEQREEVSKVVSDWQPLQINIPAETHSAAVEDQPEPAAEPRTHSTPPPAAIPPSSSTLQAGSRPIQIAPTPAAPPANGGLKIQSPPPASPVAGWTPLAMPLPDPQPAGSEISPPAEDTQLQATPPSASGLLKPLLHLAHIERRKPHLAWSESPGALSYLLEESDTPDFAQPRALKVKAGDTRWTPLWGRSGTRYYRVRACGTDQQGEWSNTLEVVI
jgi:hypothetical protein